MKAAIYCRLSEEDRNKQSEAEDSGSIQNQKSMLIQYAIVQGWEVYNIYSDDDYAGADRKRPEFNRLLQDAEAGRFEIVLCKTQSRFTRELELVEKYIHGLFPLWGIRFVSIVDNADTANKGNKKSRQINGLVNEWYLEDLSENIKSVLTNRRINGYHIGAFALYGYQKDPLRKGRLVVDEEAAATVREVFSLFDQGYGKTAIARILNDRGVPNPTEYKRLHGLRYQAPKGSTLWKYAAVSDMLTNEIYIGNMVQGKYGSVSYKTKQNKPRPRSAWFIVEGTHTPIISRELWERVQTKIAERARPFSVGTVGLFARKARCAYCGCTMRSQKNHGRRYLCCATRRVCKDACTGSFISVELLEQLVLTQLNAFSAKYLQPELLAQSAAKHSGREARKKRLQQSISGYEQKIAEYGKGLQALYLDKVRGQLAQSDFTALYEEFCTEKQRLELTAGAAQRELDRIEEELRSGGDGLEAVQKYLHLEHLNRMMVEQLVDYIAVGKRTDGAKGAAVEIHWNF